MATAINLQIFGFGGAVVSSVPDVAWQEKKIHTERTATAKVPDFSSFLAFLLNSNLNYKQK